MAFRPMPARRQWLISVLVLALLSSDLMNVWTNAKRGGGGGFGRGSSAGRSSGGIFGGSRSSGTRTGTATGGGYGGYNRGSSSGSSSGGGLLRTGTGAGNQKWTNSKYSMGSGIGSKSRSSTFKNMIVGAAAGYLTYQAGKAIIRSAAGPMMWNNRPYYWGQSHYQGSPGGQMCRMPLDASDPQFGNVYFPDNTRPKEIVWSCGYNEHCCGYETILTLILLCGCGAFIIHQVCKTRRAGGFNSGRHMFSSNAKYTPGQASHNEPPPQYTANQNGPGGSATNFVYPPAPHPPGFVYS
ncbi:CX module domain-containing protein [Ditylenchus destructor]|uniref:CX module domain-containing protein n=1 Tax=Ditylenchus destructor TaxID=166010 RepID=A0AAD4N3W8_9BILA|nr:CX module domain-containing protein [Ditylenchus destructor]